MYVLGVANQMFFLLPIDLSERVGSLLLGHLTFRNPLVAFGSDISIKSWVSRTWFSAQRLMVPPFVNALLIIKRLKISTKNLMFFIQLLKLNWILPRWHMEWRGIVFHQILHQLIWRSSIIRGENNSIHHSFALKRYDVRATLRTMVNCYGYAFLFLQLLHKIFCLISPLTYICRVGIFYFFYHTIDNKS